MCPNTVKWQVVAPIPGVRGAERVGAMLTAAIVVLVILLIWLCILGAS